MLVQSVVSGIIYTAVLLICIPSAEFITVSESGRGTDCSIVGNTEVHLLAFRAPVQRGISAGIRMQEDTVLDLPPSCIDRNTANRHLIEYIL